jgi:hypothetical protein
MLKKFSIGDIFKNNLSSGNLTYIDPWTELKNNNITGYNFNDYIDNLDSNRPIRQLSRNDDFINTTLRSLVKKNFRSGVLTDTITFEDYLNYNYSTELFARVTANKQIPFILSYDITAGTYLSEVEVDNKFYYLDNGFYIDHNLEDFYILKPDYDNFIDIVSKVLNLNFSEQTQRGGLARLNLSGFTSVTDTTVLLSGVDYSFKVTLEDFALLNAQEFTISFTADNPTLEEVITTIQTELDNYAGEVIDVKYYDYGTTINNIDLIFLSLASKKTITIAAGTGTGTTDLLFTLSSTPSSIDPEMCDKLELTEGLTKKYKVNIIRNEDIDDDYHGDIVRRDLTDFEFDTIEEFYEKILADEKSNFYVGCKTVYDYEDILFAKLETRLLFKKDVYNVVVLNFTNQRIEIYNDGVSLTENDIVNAITAYLSGIGNDYIILYTYDGAGDGNIYDYSPISYNNELITNKYAIAADDGEKTTIQSDTSLETCNVVFQENKFFKWNGSYFIEEV